MQDALPRRDAKPEDLPGCHAMIDELFDLVDAICEDRDAVVEDRDRLREAYEELRRYLYGRRGERYDDPDQMKLFDTPAEAESSPAVQDQAADPQPPEPPKKKRRRGRRRFPSHFPRVRVEHTLPETELPCPCCGKPRKIIGAEISQRLNYVPGYHEVIEDVRYKYACSNEDCEKHITTAPKPPQVIEKGAAASGLLADIVVSKFTDHLPTYRKEEISDRHGWLIPRTTQCGWLRQTAASVTVLVALMTAQVLRSRNIHTDDTPVRVIVPGEPQTHQGRFWVYVGDTQHPYSVYEFTMRRTRDGPAQFLSGYRGYLQADGYGGYEGIAIDSAGELRLVACGAHIRRRFYAQRLNAPAIAGPPLAWFRRLYLLERQWKPLSDEERYQRRQVEALPILEQFHDWLQAIVPDVLPKSKIGQAVSYALNQWEAFIRYCDAGFLSIDNNLSERSVKPCAMGRKAWLFLGSENGGATAAILYSLTASAKANQVHPFFYVRDVFDRIPEVVHDRRLLRHLVAACEHAPLTEAQRGQLQSCERPTDYLDILRCHPRALAEEFLNQHIEAELVEALTALLPDRWLATHEEYRLEINRPTGIPVGMESVLS
jgi:transposase